jgi:cathepsin L
MSVKLLALFALVAVTAARTRWHQLESYTFEDYEVEFEKEYASAGERAMRRGLVEERLKKIRAHNADPTKTWKEGVNHLTDHTEAEVGPLASRVYRVPSLTLTPSPFL